MQPVSLEHAASSHCRGVDTEGSDPECCETTCALIEACLSNNVAARPTAAQLVAALEGLQDDASEPGSPPISAQLVAAGLEQLQGHAAEAHARPVPAQIPSSASGVGSGSLKTQEPWGSPGRTPPLQVI